MFVVYSLSYFGSGVRSEERELKTERTTEAEGEREREKGDKLSQTNRETETEEGRKKRIERESKRTK